MFLIWAYMRNSWHLDVRDVREQSSFGMGLGKSSDARTASKMPWVILSSVSGQWFCMIIKDNQLGSERVGLCTPNMPPYQIVEGQQMSKDRCWHRGVRSWLDECDVIVHFADSLRLPVLQSWLAQWLRAG